MRAAETLGGVPEPLEAASGGGGGDGGDRGVWDNAKTPPILNLIKMFPDLFLKEVHERLEPTARALLGQAGSACRAAMMDSGLAVPGRDLASRVLRAVHRNFGIYLPRCGGSNPA